MKEELKNQLKYTVSSLRNDTTRKYLREAIDNGKITNDENIEFLISQLNHREVEQVIEHNERIANSIQFFVSNGYWTNLS